MHDARGNITLLVKASNFDAAEGFCRDHDLLPIAGSVVKTDFGGIYSMSVLDRGDDDHETVTKWFCEPAPDGIMPWGTLMWYTWSERHDPR